MRLIAKKIMPLWVLMVFTLISIAYFGLHGLHTFTSYQLGDKNSDKYFSLWAFQWWPYALLHGLNPFVTKVAWAPYGFNLARTTSMPGIALLAAPLTMVFGSVVSYNIFLLLAPALAAWTMFLLCRYLTQATLPAIVAGYFYGFSSFMIDHTTNHIFLTASAFLLPILCYLNLRRLNQAISKIKFIILNIVCLSLLFLFSLEIFSYYVWWASVTLLFLLIFIKNLRKELLDLLGFNIFCLLVVMLLMSPYLYFFFFASGTPVFHGHFSNDFLSLIIPTNFFIISNSHLKYLAHLNQAWSFEQNSYFGLPIFLIILLFWKQFWEHAIGKVLVWLIVLTFMVSFGPYLLIAGNSTVRLPWHHFFDLPLIRDMALTRLGLISSFFIAIMVSIWMSLGTTQAWLRYSLVFLSILFLFPTIQGDLLLQHRKAEINLPFFTNGLYKQYIKSGENVMLIPFGRNYPVAVWQAKTNFYFRMPDDAVGAISPTPKYDRIPGFNLNKPKNMLLTDFRKYLDVTQIDVIVVTEKYFKRWEPILSSLNVQSEKAGGVAIYRLKKEKLSINQLDNQFNKKRESV